MAHDESVTDNQHPLDDLAYDWVNVVKNKADALLAYAKYIRDAEAANSQECVQMFRRMYEEDARHLEEAKRHLGQVLGGKMGGQSGGQMSGGQSSQMGGGQSGGQGSQSGSQMGGQSGSQMSGGQSGGQMSNSEVGGGKMGSNTGAQS